jgi:hypothetical protein
VATRLRALLDTPPAADDDAPDEVESLIDVLGDVRPSIAWFTLLRAAADCAHIPALLQAACASTRDTLLG